MENGLRPRIGNSGGMIVGFGEGMDGEIIVFHWTGDIVEISQKS